MVNESEESYLRRVSWTVPQNLSTLGENTMITPVTLTVLGACFYALRVCRKIDQQRLEKIIAEEVAAGVAELKARLAAERKENPQ